MPNHFNKIKNTFAAFLAGRFFLIPAALFFITVIGISSASGASEKTSEIELKKNSAHKTPRAPHRPENLSSDETALAAKISNEFDKIAAGEFRGRDIFFAATSARERKLIFASDKKFYEDKAISPGSIIKIISAGLLLEEPGFDPARAEFCGDKAVIGGVRFTCSYKGGHGKVDLETAVSRSCNIYFQKAMRGVSRRKFAGTLKELGIINDKERAALLNAPDHLYYQAVIGDALIYAAPEKLLRLMRSVATNFSGPDADFGVRPFGYGNCQKLNGYLKSAVTSGTAAAKLSSLDCAGKTGSPVITVKISGNKRTVTTSAVFLGYAPYIEPRYCFFAYCSSGMGGVEAAEIARRFIVLLENE